MNSFIDLRHAFVALGLLCFLAQASFIRANISNEYENCLGWPQPAGYGFRPSFRLVQNNWYGSIINTHVAKILLEEVVGVPTEFMLVDQDGQFPLIGNGLAHASLEVWPSDTVEEEKAFILENKSIINAGPLGVIGQRGWFVPRYCLDVFPEVAFGVISDEAAAYFNNTFYLADDVFLTVEDDIIAYFNFSLNIVALNNETELLDLVVQRYTHKSPILFHFWSPHPIEFIFDLEEIKFPYLNGTHLYKPDILSKLMWWNLSDYSRESAFFVEAFGYDGDAQQSIMKNILDNTTTYSQAACAWVKANQNTWENWIIPVKFVLIPSALSIAMYVLGGVSVAATVFYLIVTLVKFRSKVIVAASGTFLISMCIGGLLIFGSLIAFITETSTGCSVFLWFLVSGFAVLFGSLFAKNGRIYLLFANKSLQIVKYSDRDVAIGVGAILLGDWVLLIASQVVQPPEYIFFDGDVSQYAFCSFHMGIGIALLIYNGLLILAGIAISVLVSRLRLTLYNEARYIALAVYNFAFAAVFVAVLFIVTDVVVKFTVLCCAIIFVGNVSLGLIFIPKVSLLFKYTEEELQQMNEAQLNAVIRSYTKKFMSGSGSNKTNTTNGTQFSTRGTIGMSMIDNNETNEEQIQRLLLQVKELNERVASLTTENEELKKLIRPSEPEEDVDIKPNCKTTV